MKTVLLVITFLTGLAALMTDSPVFDGPKKGDRIALVSIYPDEQAIMLPGELCYARVHYRAKEKQNVYVVTRVYSDRDSYRYDQISWTPVTDYGNSEVAFSIPQFTGPKGERIFAVDFALIEIDNDGREKVVSRTRKYEYVMGDIRNEKYYEQEDDGDGFIEYALR
ncbi:MAG: hypothetical protein JXR90_17150 [Spirochaetes bacterium]|nr:hypothetical protein [Spirochaetota bacterium]